MTYDDHERVDASYGEDGRLERRTRVVYDERGERVLREEDQDGDGLVDWRKVYDYDESGRRTTMTRDSDGDGFADQVWKYVYEGDSAVVVREDKLEAHFDREFCDAP
jgi:hypothetical protein